MTTYDVGYYSGLYPCWRLKNWCDDSFNKTMRIEVQSIRRYAQSFQGSIKFVFHRLDETLQVIA